ncbi:autotransporter-associated beta strand repeat-containing protein [Botrimarina colliarenosi]|uniref:autotransporter-associated beta strand repeat-containing protein n=1 Tax=Botrimarina colliarenosi TaxID=2528001 RepID=UPI0018D3CFC0|nr:autotransporter-associated beta strand repeat-containing protein [Botrimarina colliarenosi]
MNRALACAALATLVIPSGAVAQLLAFPEAEGFGRYTTGARTNLAAASVYHVTNLNDAGPGSFRDAVSQSNRFVVFDVGGIANIESVVTVASNITIAGQTAPGGFTIYNDRISFTNSHNLISRHFAVRKGDPGVRTDAASIARGSNMIFDHMSITWGVDGTFDINPDSGYVIDNITIQNSIIAQGLDRVGHSTGGLMTPGDGGSVSVIKSLYADNVTRNPKVRNENEFINNVVYGYESAGYIMGDTSGTSYANVEGNYFIEGPVDGGSPFSSGTSSFHIYANDNWVDSDRDGVLDGSLNTNYPGADVVATRHAFPTTATMTAQQAVAYVMENAGPSIIRDAVDTRLMQEVASYGTLGGVILRDTDLFPGYGVDPSYLNTRARLADTDNDGMADNWESAHGLNPANAADWKGVNAAGYTRLEEYVNELGADGSTKTSSGGTWTSGGVWTGGAPTLGDVAVTTGAVSHVSGHAFARRLAVNGTLNVSGGTLDVFDTVTANGSLTISGGAATAGRVLVSSPGQSSVVSVEAGGVLQTGTIASGGGTGLLYMNGGALRAADSPQVTVATVLGAGGATIDTAGYSGSITGPVSGSGGLMKQGDGSLTLSGANSYTGATAIEGGKLIVQGSGLGQSSGVDLAEGTTLDVSAVSGGLILTTGKSLGGSGKVMGSVAAGAGSVVRPQGRTGVQTDTGAIGIQAEDLALGSDWALFNNAIHGAGAGGSYDGADLNGGGIVLVSTESLAAPSASGVASTGIVIPESKTWYLFAKTSEPSNSPLAGDPSTAPGGNNSFWTSDTASTLVATTSNFEEVQTYANPGDEAVWNRVSPSLAALNGVVSPLNAGIDYFLNSGLQTFAIYGREVGTIIDGFVLSDSNLTAEQLETVLSGGVDSVLTVEGDFNLSAGALLEVEIAGGDALNKLVVTGAATLGGDLSLSLAEGFTPQASDVFEILEAGSLANQFGNVASGARIATEDGRGSFIVNYEGLTDLVSLSNFTEGVLGDFNGDGFVDAADYTVWRDNLGSADETSIGNAGDGLNGVDQEDYLVWKANYGATAVSASSATATPEPSGLLLGALGLLLTARRR